MSSFSFNFAGDDIDEEPETLGIQATPLEPRTAPAADADVCSVQVVRHELSDLLHSLPSQISFATTLVKSPIKGHQCLIARRSLFDVKLQLAAEDELSTTALALGGSDITTRVYEGGFKSWEGAIDLTQLLLDNINFANVDSIVELGAGTATPSCMLLQHALSVRQILQLTVADYNVDVLRLVTLPNLILAWAISAPMARESFSPGVPRVDGAHVVNGDGELSISSFLLNAFEADIRTAGISLSLLSGPWSPEFLSRCDVGSSLLALAAETIYSPQSIKPFTQTLLGLLAKAEAHNASAIIASKRIYFGVGGGVDEFVEVACTDHQVSVEEVHGTNINGCDSELESGGSGVGRCLLRVKLNRPQSRAATRS